MTTAAQTVTRNAPETDSRKTQVTVSRAIHVLSTEDSRDKSCRNATERVATWKVEKTQFFLGFGEQRFLDSREAGAGAAENAARGGLRARERPVLRTTSR